MLQFIDQHKVKYGVEPICKILPIAPSTYYHHLQRNEQPEKRCKRVHDDQRNAEQIKLIWQNSSGRYGYRKVWQQMRQDGSNIATLYG